MLDPLATAPRDLHPGTTLAVSRYVLERGESFGRHAHPQHQLSWSPSASLRAETPGAQWQLPRGLALWIPSGVPHDVGAGRAGEIYNVRFNAHVCPGVAVQPVAVEASALLAALVEHLADPALDDLRRSRAERVLLDELVPVADRVTSVPMPVDGRALAVANSLLADPADGRSLAEWGHLVGAGERTLVRFFSAQTGLTFTDWRSRVRIRAALEHLDRGESTTRTATAVGYRNVGAFIDTFRRVIGVTPGTYRLHRTTATSRTA